MWGARQARSLLGPVLLLGLGSGCQAFHQYRPVAVLARDAETGKPISGADVRISYPFTRSTSAPWDSTGPTREDGIARLRAAPYADGDILLEVEAEGYLAETKHLSLQAVQAIEPAHWFEAVDQRPVTLEMALFANPGPTVELVLPTGYRGTVQAQIEVNEAAPSPPGQRCFHCEVPPSGTALLTGPPLLQRVCPLDFRARYADGTPLSSDVKGMEIGFWSWKWEGQTMYFLVGTRFEYEALRRSEQRASAEEGHSSGGKGSGQGRHGRRGGQSAAAANP
jgi:hypothetical protein